MRGKRVLQRCEVHNDGLIPAHAGKTSQRLPRPCSRPAHPRACGENICPTEWHHTSKGSSPRMRGKLAQYLGLTTGSGLIPAHAGKTGGTASIAPKKWAHPRACGENDALAVKDTYVRGSSPRMRGKRARCTQRFERRRLIPAHAGKTPTRRTKDYLAWAHPRACGENIAVGDVFGQSGGSSPRMRGKRLSAPTPVHESGLIPAHAGKTANVHDRPQGNRAHPRACGENGLTQAPLADGMGSSPRMRGKLRKRARGVA